MSKKNRPILVTPPLIIKWAHIDKPQEKAGDVVLKVPTYSIDLAIDPKLPENQKFLADIERLAEECRAEMAQKEDKPAKRKAIENARLFTGIRKETDEDGEETGRLLIRFKEEAYWLNQKTGEKTPKKIGVFDAKRNEINPGIVGWGSKVKVATSYFPFYNAATDQAGIAWRFRAVQVLELKERGNFDAKNVFGDEEGYESTSDTDSNGFSDESSGSAEAGTGDY